MGCALPAYEPLIVLSCVCVCVPPPSSPAGLRCAPRHGLGVPPPPPPPGVAEKIRNSRAQLHQQLIFDNPKMLMNFIQQGYKLVQVRVGWRVGLLSGPRSEEGLTKWGEVY